MCWAVTMLYYVVTGIQFWYSDYAITVMEVKREIVFTIFGIVSVTGPIIGVIFGGYISGKFGGYNHPTCQQVTAAVSVLAVICSTPAGFIPKNLFALQVVLLWCLLFSGGFIMPNLTGMMLNTVSEPLKTSANALANMSFNVLGFLPSPYIYGYIADTGKVVGENKPQAMIVNLWMAVLASAPVVYHAACAKSKSGPR